MGGLTWRQLWNLLVLCGAVVLFFALLADARAKFWIALDSILVLFGL